MVEFTNVRYDSEHIWATARVPQTGGIYQVTIFQKEMRAETIPEDPEWGVMQAMGNLFVRLKEEGELHERELVVWG